MCNIAKVSVIVPVYKVEQYLTRCLDSILVQTEQKWECICINDGSPDNSLKILEEYQAKDRRFRVINQENQGVSAARNAGIELAMSPYIMFVDSDDWLDKDAIELLLNEAENQQAELVMCGHYCEGDNATTCEVELPASSEYRGIGSFAYNDMIFSYNSLSDVAVWGKLFKTELIKQNGIRFSVNVKISEDLEFCSCALCHSERISILNRSLYHYLRGDDSIMNNISRKMSVQDYSKSLTVVYHLYKCVPSCVSKARRKMLTTGLLRRALSAKRFYDEILLKCDTNTRHEVHSTTSFPYLVYLIKGQTVTVAMLYMRFILRVMKDFLFNIIYQHR